MKITSNEHGQFIIIAALMISIMIISVGALLHGTVTYFRHERWEEYLTIIDSVKIGSYRLTEISLANYTQTLNNTILRDNLNQWASDIKKAYAGFGVILASSLADDEYEVYGVEMEYEDGLANESYTQVSFSAANATFNLNITSVGLTGYEFTVTVVLKMNITDALWYKGTGSDPNEIGVRVVIESEGPRPVTNLRESNFLVFQVDGVSENYTLYRYYETQPHGGFSPLNAFVYELRYVYDGSNPGTLGNVTIGIRDTRNIQVTGQVFNLTVVDA